MNASEDKTEPLEEMTAIDYSATRKKRSRGEFIRDYAKLIEFMTRERLHEDTRREILYQAIRMYSGHNGYFDHSRDMWISEQAESLCDPKGKAHERGTVLREHVVPISVSIESLWTAPEMSETRLQALLADAGTVCIVSKAENGRLNAAGLKKHMPGKIAFAAAPRWARYDHKDVQIRRRPLTGTSSAPHR